MKRLMANGSRLNSRWQNLNFLPVLEPRVKHGSAQMRLTCSRLYGAECNGEIAQGIDLLEISQSRSAKWC
jgi:hypothetical protein